MVFLRVPSLACFSFHFTHSALEIMPVSLSETHPYLYSSQEHIFKTSKLNWYIAELINALTKYAFIP